jgi:hypothetical protein
MPRTPRNPTTGRFRRRYDPLRTEAAFDDAFGEADQDNLGREEDEELNPSDDASLRALLFLFQIKIVPRSRLHLEQPNR